MEGTVEEYRTKLLEAIAETDDTLMEKYLEGEFISAAEITQALRHSTVTGDIVPVLCGSAFKNRGVQLLLDAVVDYLPAPIDVPPIQGHLPGETWRNVRPVTRFPWPPWPLRLWPIPTVVLPLYEFILES
jgi:elongation factor G